MSETNTVVEGGGSAAPMPDGAMPEERDAVVATALTALVRAEAEFRRLHGRYGELRDTTRVIQEHVKLRDEVIAAQERTIAALQLTLKQERGRRMRPKSERQRA